MQKIQAVTTLLKEEIVDNCKSVLSSFIAFMQMTMVVIFRPCNGFQNSIIHTHCASYLVLLNVPTNLVRSPTTYNLQIEGLQSYYVTCYSRSGEFNVDHENSKDFFWNMIASRPIIFSTLCTTIRPCPVERTVPLQPIWCENLKLVYTLFNVRTS